MRERARFLEKQHGSPCCAHARSHHHPDTIVGAVTGGRCSSARDRRARAGSWAGEPFLHAGEDPGDRARPGHGPPRRARRRARRDRRRPEDAVPPLARPLRADARAGARARVRDADDAQRAPICAATRSTRSPGMLTELIASNQRAGDGERQRERQRRGPASRSRPDAEDGRGGRPRRRLHRGRATPAFEGDDPGAVRRFRFRHPTASGKTIAAAGFVEAAQTSAS